MKNTVNLINLGTKNRRKKKNKPRDAILAYKAMMNHFIHNPNS